MAGDRGEDEVARLIEEGDGEGRAGGPAMVGLAGGTGTGGAVGGRNSQWHYCN